MSKRSRTNQELLEEMSVLKQRIRELEKAVAESQRAVAASSSMASIVRYSRELINLAKPDGTMVFLNDAGKRMLGISEEDTARTNIMDVIPGHLRDKIQQELMPSLERDGYWEGDLQYLNVKTGELTDVYAVTFKIDDPETGLAQFLANVSLDITERKRAAEVLKKSEQQLALAIEGSGVGLWDWRVQTGETEFNDRWVQIVGYTKQELAPLSIDTWNNLVHPEDLEKSNLLLQQHFASRLPIYECEARMRHKDGHWVWVLDRGKVVEWDDDGKPVRMTGTHLDITERKQAEEARRKTEEKYRLLIENSHDIIYTLTPDGIFTFISPGWNVILEHSAAEVIGKPFQQFIHPEDVGRCEVFLDNVIRTGKRQMGVEFRVQHGDGSWHWYSSNGVALRNEAGEVVSCEGIAIDITARKLAEETIRQSDRYLSNVIEFFPDATLVIDKEGTVIAWNRAIEEMTGISKTDMIGKGNYEYALPFYGERRPLLIDLVLTPREDIEARYIYTERKRLVLIAEAYLPDLRGRDVYLSGKASALLDLQGNIIGAIESIRDITDRKRAEEKYRDIFENVAMGIFQATPDGRIISANPAFARILGYTSPAELMQAVSSIAQLYVHPERRFDFLELLNEQGQIQEQEIQFIRKDGSTGWITVSARAAKDSNGVLIYYEGTIWDISDRKLLESQLRQAQKMEAIGTLAGGIAHDFNNILSAIMGYTDMALQMVQDNHRLEHHLQQVFTAGERARDLVRQILAFSRQSEGKLGPLKVSPIIKEVLKLLRASLPSTIEVSQNIRTDPDTVLADPTHIYQILMNLCTNAAHAMQDGKGTLHVELACEEVKAGDILRHYALAPGMYLKLTVADTGVGIDAGIIERIFDPFFTTRKPGEGTGMGLSMVYGIVKNYGGMIDVKSEAGQGSEFSVYLPLLIQTAAGPETMSDETVSGGKERILLVDDENMLVDLGKRMLTGLGYDVVGRTDSLEALELFRRDPERFDIVVTDMTMPKMTGIELARELLRLRPGLPIILCTGFSDATTPKKVKDTGIKTVVMKPIIKLQLAAAIRQALDAKE